MRNVCVGCVWAGVCGRDPGAGGGGVTATGVVVVLVLVCFINVTTYHSLQSSRNVTAVCVNQ